MPAVLLSISHLHPLKVDQSMCTSNSHGNRKSIKSFTSFDNKEMRYIILIVLGLCAMCMIKDFNLFQNC